MNTYDLEKCLSKLKIFKGVYPRDLLPAPSDKPCIIIANTDSSYEIGTHWVAFYFTSHGPNYYFDSYGLYPSQLEFESYLLKYSRNNWMYNCKQLQGVTSDVCGHYVSLFTYCMSKGYSIQDFLNLFSTNVEKNDVIVCKIMQSIKCTGRGRGQTCRGAVLHVRR